MLARLRRSIRPRWWLAAIRCLLPLHNGVTVVIVNWNGLHLLRDTLAALRRYAPDARVIVVDNGSTDGSVDWLRTQGVKTIPLDTNMRHGPGLDIGFLAARTRYVIALDSDAFPISPDWLDTLLGPLNTAHVVGVEGGIARDQALIDRSTAHRTRPAFVHPCCAAMRLRRFVYRRHTWRTHKTDRKMDVGELLSQREAGHLAFLEPTSLRGPGSLGQVHGRVVYHNAYGTRHQREGAVVDGLTVDEPHAAWSEAVAAYLG